MSEIVYTHTEKVRDHIKHMDFGRSPTDNKVTIFQSPGKVALVHSTLVCGVPRGHKDKRYYYWRSVRSMGFRRNSTGTVIPYHCRRPWDAKVGVHWQHQKAYEPFNFLEGGNGDNDPLGQAFQHAVMQEFGVRSVFDVFPMLEKYRLPTYNTIPNSLRVPFREDQWDVFAAKVFGKTRVTPKLVAAVGYTDPYVVACAQQFRGLVPDNELIGFMYRNKFDEETEETFTPHSPNFRPFLLAAGSDVATTFIKSKMDKADIRSIYSFSRTSPNGMNKIGRYAERTKSFKKFEELSHW